MKKVAIICTLVLVLILGGLFLTPTKAVASAKASHCQADLNGDGTVTTADLLIFLGCYNCHLNGNCVGCAPCDFNGDHKVDWQDYIVIAGEINSGCGS